MASTKLQVKLLTRHRIYELYSLRGDKNVEYLYFLQNGKQDLLFGVDETSIFIDYQVQFQANTQ